MPPTFESIPVAIAEALATSDLPRSVVRSGTDWLLVTVMLKAESTFASFVMRIASVVEPIPEPFTRTLAEVAMRVKRFVMFASEIVETSTTSPVMPLAASLVDRPPSALSFTSFMLVAVATAIARPSEAEATERPRSVVISASD